VRSPLVPGTSRERGRGSIWRLVPFQVLLHAAPVGKGAQFAADDFQEALYSTLDTNCVLVPSLMSIRRRPPSCLGTPPRAPLLVNLILHSVLASFSFFRVGRPFFSFWFP